MQLPNDWFEQHGQRIINWNANGLPLTRAEYDLSLIDTPVRAAAVETGLYILEKWSNEEIGRLSKTAMTNLQSIRSEFFQVH
ncbi:hypothetical protein [Vibrio barjaei]|uniref:hypothetical protein n=1 Tax=Vibrio barjaei TaxID=1676683 RepID=UPI002284AD69|nr:hypothetical protein [Vibrio barjaei]MCY9873820.1 hypothetical protein [Vibrio barjaei]